MKCNNAFTNKVKNERKRRRQRKRSFYNVVPDHHTHNAYTHTHTANYSELSFIYSCAFLLITISRYVNFMKKFLKFCNVCTER